MVKIGNNLYRCDWCLEEIKYKPRRVSADVNPNKNEPGRHTTTATLTCPKCGRNVRQRTPEGTR